MNRRISLVVWLMSAMAALSSPSDFSKYQVILDRKPFGEPPLPVEEVRVTPPSPASFLKDIRLCGMTESAGFGMCVGFIDTAAKKNYYLHVGSSEDGIEVVDADYEREAALLKKGAEQGWISMSGETFNDDLKAAVASMPEVSHEVAAMVSKKVAAQAAFEARVKKRREALEVRRKAEAEKFARNGGELDPALKAYQMDAIRARGEAGPVLPIPLTKAMDDKLVAEGVLPPVAEAGSEEPPPAEPAP